MSVYNFYMVEESVRDCMLKEDESILLVELVLIVEVSVFGCEKVNLHVFLYASRYESDIFSEVYQGRLYRIEIESCDFFIY